VLDRQVVVDVDIDKVGVQVDFRDAIFDDLAVPEF
jgi:hypothetical protein